MSCEDLMLKRQLRKGFLKIAILKMLKERPMCAYEIMKTIEEKTGGLWVPSYSTIHSHLIQMSMLGYIKGERGGERGKIVYRITPKGEEVLKRAIKVIKEFVENLSVFVEELFKEVKE